MFFIKNQYLTCDLKSNRLILNLFIILKKFPSESNLPWSVLMNIFLSDHRIIVYIIPVSMHSNWMKYNPF